MEEITDEEELSINEAKEYYDILKYYNWSF